MHTWNHQNDTVPTSQLERARVFGSRPSEGTGCTELAQLSLFPFLTHTLLSTLHLGPNGKGGAERKRNSACLCFLCFCHHFWCKLLTQQEAAEIGKDGVSRVPTLVVFLRMHRFVAEPWFQQRAWPPGLCPGHNPSPVLALRLSGLQASRTPWNSVLLGHWERQVT